MNDVPSQKCSHSSGNLASSGASSMALAYASSTADAGSPSHRRARDGFRQAHACQRCGVSYAQETLQKNARAGTMRPMEPLRKTGPTPSQDVNYRFQM